LSGEKEVEKDECHGEQNDNRLVSFVSATNVPQFSRPRCCGGLAPLLRHPNYTPGKTMHPGAAPKAAKLIANQQEAAANAD